MANTCTHCGKHVPTEPAAYRDATCACGAVVLSDAQQALQQRAPRCGTCDCVMTAVARDQSGNAAFACPWCNPPTKTMGRPVPIVGSAENSDALEFAGDTLDVLGAAGEVVAAVVGLLIKD